MEQLINEFETIIILKTIVFDVNLNFLDLDDLNKIQYAAYDMDIDITDYNLDDVYNSDYDKIESIYNIWREEVYEEYLRCKNGLLKLI